MPVELAPSRIMPLIERYRPQVVVTYEPRSARHPDHVHAARVTTYAVDTTRVVGKLYYTAHGTGYWRLLNRALADIGVHRPSASRERQTILESVEQQITTVINVHHVVDRKRAALHSHSSQLDSSLAGKFPEIGRAHV